MPTKIGRNESCSCGSGRKYKKCCGLANLRKTTPTGDFGWQAVRKLEGTIVDEHLMPYLLGTLRASYMQHAIEDFFPEHVQENMPEEETELFLENCILPWALFNWAPFEDYGHTPFDHGKTPAENYLNHHGDRLNKRERAFINAMLKTYYSFYRVIDVEEGQTITVKDTILGTTHTIKEKTASRSIRKGDFVASRILNFEDQSIFIGMLPKSIPSQYRPSINEFTEYVHETAGKELTGALLRDDYEIEIIDEFFDILEAATHATPTLANTDGEPLQFTQSRFKLSTTCEEAAQKLLPMTLEKSVDDLFENHITEFNTMNQLQSIEFPWLKKGNKVNKSWDNTVLGQFKITESLILLETNSAERAAKGKSLIKKHLGKNVSFVNDVIESAEQKLKNTPKQTAAEKAEFEALQNTPEIQAQLSAMIQQHWQDWLNVAIPALKNQTPMQAAKTPKGRVLLEELLLDFENSNQAQKDPLQHIDIDFLRQELNM